MEQGHGQARPDQADQRAGNPVADLRRDLVRLVHVLGQVGEANLYTLALGAGVLTVTIAFRWRPRSAALGTDEPVSDGMVSVRPNGFIDPCIASAQRSGTSPDSNASLSTVEPVSIRTANSSWEKMLWGGGEEIASIVADVNRWSPQCKRRTT